MSRCPGGCPGLAPSMSRLVFRGVSGSLRWCPVVSRGVRVNPVRGLISRPHPLFIHHESSTESILLLAVAPWCPDGVPDSSPFISFPFLSIVYLCFPARQRRSTRACACVCMCMCMYSYIVTHHHTLLVMDSDNRDSLKRHDSFALDEES